MRGRKAKQIRRECFGKGGRKAETPQYEYINQGGFSGFYVHREGGFVVPEYQAEIFRRPWLDGFSGKISILQPIQTNGTIVNKAVGQRTYKTLKKEYRNNWYDTRWMFDLGAVA